MLICFMMSSRRTTTGHHKTNRHPLHVNLQVNVHLQVLYLPETTTHIKPRDAKPDIRKNKMFFYALDRWRLARNVSRFSSGKSRESIEHVMANPNSYGLPYEINQNILGFHTLAIGFL